MLGEHAYDPIPGFDEPLNCTPLEQVRIGNYTEQYVQDLAPLWEEAYVAVRAPSYDDLAAIDDVMVKKDFSPSHLRTGDVTADDVATAAAHDHEKRAILAYDVDATPDAQDRLDEAPVAYMEDSNVYMLVRQCDKWFQTMEAEERQREPNSRQKGLRTERRETLEQYSNLVLAAIDDYRNGFTFGEDDDRFAKREELKGRHIREYATEKHDYAAPADLFPRYVDNGEYLTDDPSETDARFTDILHWLADNLNEPLLEQGTHDRVSTDPFTPEKAQGLQNAIRIHEQA